MEIREGAHLRRVLPMEGAQRVPWDVACVREVLPSLDAPFRIVMIGGGASSAPHAIVREHPLATVEVLERTGAVVELGREHFATGLAISRGDRLSVGAGNLEDQISELVAQYDALVIDTTALAAIGGAAGLSRSALDRLRAGLAPRGLIIWGPVSPEPGQPEVPEGWGHAAYARPASGAGPGETVLFTRLGLDVDWPGPFDDFQPSAL